MGPEKGNEREDLHLKTGLEHSTLIGIQEEESDKKYVGQITLQYNYLIVLCTRKYFWLGLSIYRCSWVFVKRLVQSYFEN